MAVSFPPELVEDVRALVDIVDVVAEHVELRRSGTRYVGLCPFHSEKTPSFSVDRERQLFHCFGCQVGGDVFSFVMQRTGLPFPQAVEELAIRVGIDTSQFAATDVERQRQQRRRELLDVHRVVAQFYVQVLRSAAGRGARTYLQSRRIHLDTVEKFGLGYAPAADGFLKFLSQEGIDEKLALEAGLLGEGRDGRPPYPRFRERLMFPIWDRGGRIIGFGGRLIEDKPRAPKYLNSPETPLFSKRRTVYGTHLAARAAGESGQVIVVEGYTDCLRLSQHGSENVVASLGTAFTEQQARLLHSLAETALVAFDADTAGEAATVRSLDLLATTGMHVAVVQLPEGSDPDDFVLAKGTAAWQQQLSTATPLVEYKLRKAFAGVDLNTVDGRARAVRAAVNVLKDVGSPVALEGYIGLVAEKTGITPAAIEAEMRLLSPIRSTSSKERHSNGKNRHNNKGFRRMGSEQPSRGATAEKEDRPAPGGERLSYAEHVILRHVLAGNKPVVALNALQEEAEWSTPDVAAAAALLRERTQPGPEVTEWLQSLSTGPGATLLQRLWLDEALAEAPWADACRALRQQRGLQRLLRLERDLQRWVEADERGTAGTELAKLLLEYKKMRSDLLDEQV